MRIRSIKPEFWRSDDIAALSWDDRLLFIGLWSYVDDNGVGRDEEKLITADLFALDQSFPETLGKVSGGLQRLSAANLIERYTVGGRDFLHIVTWDKHQRVHHPNPGRYPLPKDGVTRGTGDSPETLPRDSREIPETLPPGTGEQGNRGTVTPSLHSGGLQGGDVHDDPAAGCGSGSHVVADAPTDPAEAKPKRKTTGTRLPDGWFPSRTDANLRTERESGLTDRELQDALDNFRDYWAAQPGQRGRKADWDATWRNWVRRVSKQHHPRRQDQTTQILADAMARANAGINVFKEAS